MGHSSDLPHHVVQRIAHFVHQRNILGTNKCACLCRQWRDAGSSWQAEQLQLFLDVRFMSAEEVARASNWLAMHGQSVDVLAMALQASTPALPAWVPTAAASFTNLRRLEVDDQHSLSLLAPVLGQLPQLQHLAAQVSMVAKPSEKRQHFNQAADGVFQNHMGQPREQMPDLRLSLPGLTHLRLGFVVTTGILKTDRQLPRLLPPGLQHLTLSSAVQGMMRMQVVLRPMALTHLVALQQLTLEGVDVDDQVCEALAEHLGALQQLRVRRPPYAAQEPEQLLPLLGPKIVDYTICRRQRLLAATRMVQLTRLVWYWEHQVPQGAADALAAMTGLRELGLHGCLEGHAAVEVMQVLAGMVQLRSLQLEGPVASHAEISSSLGQCTQLTGLELTVTCSGDDTIVPVPQQLVALQHLTVPSLLLLEHDAVAWLAPLTALTRLCVIVWVRNGGVKGAQKLLQQVQVWPASLKQVVVWEAKQPIFGKGPCSWQHTPSEAGGVHLDAWFEDADRDGGAKVARNWARPFRPCPHLPGVWELRGEVQPEGTAG
jgi:hypothetical protein